MPHGLARACASLLPLLVRLWGNLGRNRGEESHETAVRSPLLPPSSPTAPIVGFQPPIIITPMTYCLLGLICRLIYRCGGGLGRVR